MPQITIPVRVLESHSGEYQGNAYTSVLARFNGRVLKFKSSISLEDYVDEDVTVELDIIPGQNSAATLKIKRVVS